MRRTEHTNVAGTRLTSACLPCATGTRHTRAAGTRLSMNGTLRDLGRCLSPSGSLKSVAASPRARPPLDQDADSEEHPPSSVLSGWLVLGVALQLGHRRSSQRAGRVGAPRSSALLNHMYLVVHQHGHARRLILELRRRYLDNLPDLLDGRHLSLCHSVDELRPRYLNNLLDLPVGRPPVSVSHSVDEPRGISTIFWVFWMVGTCLSVAVRMNCACGFSTVFWIFWMVRTCLCVTEEPCTALSMNFFFALPLSPARPAPVEQEH